MHNTIELGKLPPQAIDLEEAVLGAVLIESSCLDRIINLISYNSFYKNENQEIFKSILALKKDNKAIDILTVSNYLKQKNELESVGGIYNITKLTSKIASSSNVEYHSHIIQQKYIQREIIRTSNDVQNAAYNDEDELIDLINSQNNYINSLLNSTTKEKHIKSVLIEAQKELSNKIEKVRNGINIGITSGLNNLDKITGGFQNSDLIVLAARPAMGKTAMLLKWAKSAAIDKKIVRIYELEMSSIRLIDRLLIAESGVDANKYRNGYLKNSELQLVDEAALRLSNLDIIIDDNPIRKVSEIHASCRIAKNKNECDFVLIDYLQLAQATKEKNKNREQEVAEMTRQLKIMAKDLNVPVVLLAQLSRGVEARKDKRPMLSDLRESGAIEQDADIVCFLYRGAEYGEEYCHNVGEIIIGKHRQGECGIIKFSHNDSLTDIFDYEEKF